MARFRCPSPTLEAIDAANTEKERVAAVNVRRELTKQSSSHRVIRGPHKERGTRAPYRKHAAPQEQAKAFHKQPGQVTYKETMEHGLKYVFVGNLPTDINEGQLREVFAQFGTIVRVVIRLSGGCVLYPTAGKGGCLPENRLYASVQFTESNAAREALNMTGVEVRGRSILVVRHVLDLPTFKPDQISKQRSTTHEVKSPQRKCRKDPTKFILNEGRPSPKPTDVLEELRNWLVRTRLGILKDIFPSPYH
ncbi:hypothetical protein PHLCEN_2v10601 [Hermanssonia centrifuga]|uniref:RRM domain-containing protein n=1 Tax=Hermanssonia centrifuga TaxID=98765 RepID=A0A2R6NN21_9APHY|nr:hypothetical protein PHLCEN_2v10601 [Hermanssonia centrifuga]